MTAKIIGRGAEAVLTETTFKGRKAVVKNRMRKAYRHPALDAKLRKSRTRREERVLRHLSEREVSVPVFFDAKGTSLTFSFENGVLAREAKLTPLLLKKIGVELARMHGAGVAHGDFTTSNVMVQGKRVKIIDFGLSVFSHSAEDFATDLVLFEKTVSLGQFKVFLEAYAKAKKDSRAVIARFGEIKQRGRYVER